MTNNQFYTYHEIKTQTEAWQQAFDLTMTASLPDASHYEQVIFTGCGSTYYLSLAAAALYQELSGRPARAAPASELLLNPRTVWRDFSTGGDRSLLVAISRSGTTTETIRAVERFRADDPGDVIVITNNHTSLTDLADQSIVISKGQEQSVAQTKSFASMYVAAAALCARMADRPDLLKAMANLPAVGERLVRDYESTARKLGENLDYNRFYFLGSGIRYGLACEVSLKMKEMTLSHSEPFHFLEFRHGPMSMVNQHAAIIGLLSEVNFDHESKVLTEMQTLGSTTFALGETAGDVAFNSGIPESVRGVLYLPVLQLMAYYRSVVKGLDPDHPNNLSAVIQLDL
jgi:glutamine---fructose-6-phosphate transaminase (isomerizing)